MSVYIKLLDEIKSQLLTHKFGGKNASSNSPENIGFKATFRFSMSKPSMVSNSQSYFRLLFVCRNKFEYTPPRTT